MQTLVKLNLKSVLVSVALLFALVGSSAFAGTNESLQINFTGTALSFIPKDGSVEFSSNGFWGKIKNDWDFKPVTVDGQGQGVYHIRRKSWKGLFLNADTIRHQIYKVMGADETFGSAKSQGILIPGAFVMLTGPESIIRGIFIITFKSSSLIYTPQDGNLQFTASGIPILDKDDLEIKQIRFKGEDTYQIRYKQWVQKFWQVNPGSEKAWWTNAGTFGIREGGRTMLSGTSVKAELIKKTPDILADLGFADANETRRPKSNWIESRKALYQKILKQNTYDILIVPFQIQGYAVDRPGRSLMTRYLADRITRLTDAKVPDPTLVARAFGEDTRMIDEEEVYRIARELNVKTIIRGYVGHYRDEKMKLTLLIQKANGGGVSSATKATRLDWNNIPFSDVHLPEAAFYNILSDIMSELPLGLKLKRPALSRETKNDIALPANIMAMTTTKTDSRLTEAYYLQLLGTMFPRDTTDRAHLFERSLVLLSDTRPQSHDYALLRARALFYLHRRPAALSALGRPATPESKSFLALLNGNLPEMKESVQTIKSPLKKLMAQIELFDLRTSYKEQVTDADYLNITNSYPDWEEIVMRRLRENDAWFTQSNLAIKKAMDQAFPIPNFKVDDLLRRKMALGNATVGDASDELSTCQHYQRFLTSHGKDIAGLTGSPALTKWDYLDLLYAVSEANLFKGITVEQHQRGITENALKMMDNYEALYRDHPGITYLRSQALRELGWRKKDNEYMIGEAEKRLYEALFWYGGQTDFNSRIEFPYYDADYPQRPHWWTKNGDRSDLKGDKIFDKVKTLSEEDFQRNKLSRLRQMKNYSLSLQYTHNQFWPLEEYYKNLSWIKVRKDDAQLLLDENKNRFVGSPDRLNFYVKLGMESGDPIQKIRVLEDAITLAPDTWTSYSALGKHYIEQGDIKKAQAIFLKYPLFKIPKDDYRVRMSHYALEAAAFLLWCGGIEESIPLFEIAANSRTYSASELQSSAFLAWINGDYPRAASFYQRLIKRYEDTQGYGDYMTLLHILGFHKEAWSIFNTLDIQSKSPHIWISAFIGHRMEAETTDRIYQWLKQDHFKKVDSIYVSRYLLLSSLTDRPADHRIPEMIESIIRESPSPNRQDQNKYLVRFVGSYNAMKRMEYAAAYNIMKKEPLLLHMDYVWPYYIWCGMKSGKKQEMDRFLKSIKAFASPTYLYLARAFYDGLQSRHEEAIRNLKLARYNVPFTGERPIFPWYQLIEACELLYKDTGHETYRDLVLEWARIHQKLQPWFGWAYGVEAKHTKSATDRVRALALALYLDKNSEHISGLSKSDKADALKWLEKNNPFLKSKTTPQQVVLGNSYFNLTRLH